MNLSLRLRAVADRVPHGAIIHDVGTDHGFLPIYLLEHGRVSLAFASDLRAEPLKSAASNGAHFIQQQQLILSQQDGFLPLDPRVNCITISGLGGALMAQLFAAHYPHLTNVNRIILQPQSQIDTLRQSMQSIGFRLIDEVLLKEAEIFYEVLVYEKGHQLLTEHEILCGPLLLKHRDHLFHERWQQEAEYCRQLLQQIPPSHPSYQRFQHRLSLIQEVL